MSVLVSGKMVRGLPLLKFENDNLYVAYECGKKSMRVHSIIIEKSILEPLELLHIDLYGPSTIESMHQKKYILIIVDDCTRFTWVFFLRLKSKKPFELINFIKGIEVFVKLPIP